MSTASPMRIARDQLTVVSGSLAQDPLAEAGSLACILPAERQLESAQEQVVALQAEIDSLRRRDDTLNFYMQRMDEEMRLAARLQQDFLPKSLPQVGSVHFHTLFRPAGYVSGDLYDVMRLDESHVGFYMADAVGHGIPAALLTMFIKNALLTKEIYDGKYRLLRPCETMARLNDTLVHQRLSNATFATALYGTINTQTLQVCFAVGGHPAPVVIRHNGTIEDTPAEGSLLGIFENEQFSDFSIQLARGDKLFVFTDGVEVCFPSGDMADTQRWREELHQRRHLPAQDLLRAFAQQIDQTTGSILPKDDLTIIMIEIR